MTKPTPKMYSAYLDELLADGPWALFDSSGHTLELEGVTIPKRSPRGYGKGAWVQTRMWISDEEVDDFHEMLAERAARSRRRPGRGPRTPRKRRR